MDDNNNIWQASKYLLDGSANSALVPISGLTTRNNKYVIENLEIAATLVGKSFPPLPSHPTSPTNLYNNQLETSLVTEKEVQEAIFQASLLKKAGHDRIPALVLQKTWPILKDFLVPLLQVSLLEGKLPAICKIAKISL